MRRSVPQYVSRAVVLPSSTASTNSADADPGDDTFAECDRNTLAGWLRLCYASPVAELVVRSSMLLLPFCYRKQQRALVVCCVALIRISLNRLAPLGAKKVVEAFGSRDTCYFRGLPQHAEPSLSPSKLLHSLLLLLASPPQHSLNRPTRLFALPSLLCPCCALPCSTSLLTLGLVPLGQTLRCSTWRGGHRCLNSTKYRPGRGWFDD